MRRSLSGGLIVLFVLGCGGEGGGTGVDNDRGTIGGSVRNGGTGVAGVSVSLSGGASRTTTTSVAGAFSFTNLAPGAYTVGITVPAGLQLGAGEASSKAATVSANQTSTVNFDLATPAPTTGIVAGSVREGQAGVAGATVTLTATGVTRATASAVSGSYQFADVAPGAYNVRLSLPSGYGLAQGEVVDKTANVTVGQTATVNFSIVNLTPTTVVDALSASFSPSEVTVNRGARVRWVNNSGTLHNVTPSGHSEWALGDLASGSVFEHIFNAAGTFSYLCSLHAGMTGVVRVQ